MTPQEIKACDLLASDFKDIQDKYPQYFPGKHTFPHEADTIYKHVSFHYDYELKQVVLDEILHQYTEVIEDCRLSYMLRFGNLYHP